MRVALVGPGGVGAGFGAYLAEAGHEVVALARGRHLEAIRAEGLIVRRPGGELRVPVRASDRAADLGTVDLVLFAVKLWDTEAAARQMAPMLGAQTMVLVLQNGVDALDLLAPILGRDRLLGGVAQISAVIAAPGVVAHRSPFARIIAGEPAGGHSDRVTGLVDRLSDAGIEAQASPQIAVDLWAKFVFIVGLSGATSLFRAPIGPIRETERTAAFLCSLVTEAVAVGRAEGVALPDDQVERTMAFVAGLPGAMTASMCEDLLAGHRLELPWLAGRVVRSGSAHGIPTPANATVELGLLLHTAGQPAR
ncbi:MAG: 2-dehydropantoate 2-reductase [Rhodobacteraceae bacterium]|nr:2-dehydropantoate 2-reductase [Paracoccaceae bacterium]